MRDTQIDCDSCLEHIDQGEDKYLTMNISVHGHGASGPLSLVPVSVDICERCMARSNAWADAIRRRFADQVAAMQSRYADPAPGREYAFITKEAPRG